MASTRAIIQRLLLAAKCNNDCSRIPQTIFASAIGCYRAGSAPEEMGGRRSALAIQMTIRHIALLFLVISAAACGREADRERTQLTVFAASSLSDAFDDLSDAFERRHPDVDLLVHYAGSSQLAAQIAEGAVADVFASANFAQMQQAIGIDRVDAARVQPFATNALILITPSDNPAAIGQFSDVAKPDVELVLAAAEVPARLYTDQIIAAMPPAFQQRFYENVQSEEPNVRQVVAKVALGEADAGIVYRSDILSDHSGRLQQFEIPGWESVRAVYLIAPLDDSRQPALADQFIDFVLSADGQQLLIERGFGAPTDD